jgi:hypothetical protein
MIGQIADHSANRKKIVTHEFPEGQLTIVPGATSPEAGEMAREVGGVLRLHSSSSDTRLIRQA